MLHATEAKGYCGPTAVAALTGVPVGRIENMIRRKRRGGYRDRNGRRMPVRGTYTWEIVRVLKRLGCKVEKMADTESTFGRFCDDTAHMSTAFLVEVTGHFMAVHRGMFVDTSHREPTTAAGYAKATRRVKLAWRIEAPAVPKYTTAEAPVREPKPKPDIRTVRAARVAKRLDAWIVRRKRADTAIRKLTRQARYYGLETNC